MTEMRDVNQHAFRPSAVVLIIRVLLCLAFLYAGAEKLLPGGRMWIRLFDEIGLGQWFRYVTALVEISAGALMLVPRGATVGALLAMSSMVGALIVHATVIGFGPPTIAVLVLLALSTYVVWSGRDQIPAVLQFKVTRKRLIGGAAGLLALYTAWAALPGREFDVTGRWGGRTLTGLKIVLDLKADGTALSGTLTRNQRSRPITDGTIGAEGLSFNAMLGRQNEHFSGTYRRGERLHVTVDSMGPVTFLTSVTFRRE